MEYRFESIGPMLNVVVVIFLFVFVLAIVASVVGIAALPGLIARKRHHPQAAAINMAGWFGLPTGIVWVLAMVYAYWQEPQQTATMTESQQQMLMDQMTQLEKTIEKLEGLRQGTSS